jgi:hypothetical protein
MTALTDAELLAAFAESLTRWDDDRIETRFTDPSTGEPYVFVITRSAAAKPSPGDRDRLMIRARGEAMRDLVLAHGPEFAALLAVRLRELGMGAPEFARRT